MKLILFGFSLLLNGSAMGQTATASLVIDQSVLPGSRSTQQTTHTLLAYNQIQSQANAAYRAGQSILLHPGFEAQAGSVFLALIGEPVSLLQARLLSNPVVGSSAQVAITGVGGQAVSLRLLDLQGRPIYEQRIEQAAETERVDLPLGNHWGQLLLRVNTDTQQQSLKLLRP